MENTRPNRRAFISTSVITSLGFAAGLGTVASSVSSCKVFKPAAGASRFNTPFTQQPLPYSYGSLDRAIDATTMEIHYSKHASGYATNLQEAARNEGVDMNKPVEDVLARISKFSTKMRNNGGGHYNHELFWKCMAPNGGGRPTGRLLTSLEEAFGSFDSFKNQFADQGKNRFGSGWAWLVLDADKRLRLGSTPNQDNPLMDLSEFKGNPLLGLDVWEHAYYLRYQNKRPDYITNWWEVVNWNYVGERFEAMS